MLMRFDKSRQILFFGELILLSFLGRKGRKVKSKRLILTFIKCLFTHFVKVFFCTRSRSSAKMEKPK